MAQRELPKVAITMGDPAGIGPEICLLALTNPDVTRACRPFVFGDAAVLQRAADEIGLEPPEHVIPWAEWQTDHESFEKPAVVDMGLITAESVVPGATNAETGQASFEYVVRAIDSAMAGQVAAVTTGPIQKEAWHAAGVTYPGHTELFADRMGVTRSCMMLTSSVMTCSLVTSHAGYFEVPGLLSVERIQEVIELTAEAMKKIKGVDPRIAVCGLNPHAGEHGLFGQGEEERFIIPAIEACRANGVRIEGPWSADTAFLPAKRREIDAYVCLYHDQGLIPLKTLAFEDAINITLGLPKVRTSVDHGTALDIAWKGRANPTSLFEAIQLAARLSFTPA
jgi:4-phospho-D-threonate 3-dehydrogenase / 4-phospho-D-erythronate 3-dehydrogenase